MLLFIASFIGPINDVTFVRSSVATGDPRIASNTQGNVNSLAVNVKEPSIAVVVDAVPATHLAFTFVPPMEIFTGSVPDIE